MRCLWSVPENVRCMLEKNAFSAAIRWYVPKMSGLVCGCCCSSLVLLCWSSADLLSIITSELLTSPKGNWFLPDCQFVLDVFVDTIVRCIYVYKCCICLIDLPFITMECPSLSLVIFLKVYFVWYQYSYSSFSFFFFLLGTATPAFFRVV